MAGNSDDDGRTGARASNGRWVTLDTSDYPERDRLAAWREEVSRSKAAFDCELMDGRPFYGRMETANFGPVRIHREDCSAARWRRSGSELADGTDSLSLFLATSGPFGFRQGDFEGLGQAGQFAITDHVRPSELSLVSSGVDYDIILPREALLRTQRDPARLSPGLIGQQSAGLKLLRGYIDSILDSDADYSDPLMAQKIAEHVIDLVALGLRPTRDASEQAGGRGLKEARVRAILEEIGKRFSEEGVSAAAIAARFNISSRYLNKLLEETGESFAQHVLELRLRKAARLLTDPGFDPWRIGQIAYECGFSDLSYFNRCFRHRFGDTPAGVRGGRSMPL